MRDDVTKGTTRRAWLQWAAVLGAGMASACGPTGGLVFGEEDGGSSGGDGAPGSETGGPPSPGSDAADGGATKPAPGKYRTGIAAFTGATKRRAAVRRAVELAGGVPWIKSGDRVLIKVAHNSPNAYPATASPESAGELAELCLEAGAGKVYVVDLMGTENTLIPGGWALENKYGRIGPFDATTDATVRAFKNSGLYAGVEASVGASNVGPTRKVHITSFRELNWRRFESASKTPGGASNARLVARWVEQQLKDGVNRKGLREPRLYEPRKFDELFSDDVPGMFLPNLFDEVDHVINLGRVSTHIMSHFSTALKNWIGIMRPDDRLWMHQLTYLRNDRGTGDDPIRTEPPYHEILPELHLATWERERLVFADASEILISGGPDESPDPSYPSRLMLASTDLISADVTNLAVLRMGVLASVLEGGLGGKCAPQPSSFVEAGFDYLLEKKRLLSGGLMRGTDPKLCDPTFSNWDWLAIQRARELGLGPSLPKDVSLLFAEDADHAVTPAHRKWIELDALRPPTRALL